MFEVEYPNEYGLDGKVHQIQIMEAYEVEVGNKKEIIVYGLDQGKLEILSLRYNSDINNYVFVPHTKMEIVNLTSPYLDRIDITNELIKKLDGKRIKNIIEINNTFNQTQGDSLHLQSKSVNSSQEQIKEMVKGNDDYIKENYPENEDKIKNDNVIKTIEEQDVMDILKYNYKQAIRLLRDFVASFYESKKNYHKDYAIQIENLIEKLCMNMVKVSETIYTEDELIDLGSFIAKLSVSRVNSMNDKEFNNLINDGYAINEKIEKMPKKK